MKQLEDREKLKYLGKEMKNIELEESEMKVHDHKNFEQLKQSVNKHKQLTYKEMLDNQISVRNSLKVYGNMTNVEKQLNKDDLEAYKNYKHTYNSLIPGLNNNKTIQL